MWMNLLTEALPEGYQKVSISVAALYALIGFTVVFAGIALLIFIVWAVGKVMHKNAPQTSVKKAPVVEPQIKQELAIAADDGISEETVAVIMAALTAYYQTNNPKCEFTVKRIKRI